MRCPLLFIIVVKALSKFIRAGFSEELLYELLEGLETWKSTLESTGLREIARKKKAIVIDDKAGKVRKKEKLFYEVCSKGVSNNSFLYQFFKFTQHRICICIRGMMN